LQMVICRWGLGVLAYVLLTGRQPFSSPKTDDPMVVMRRIVDDTWHVKYPPYLSALAKVRSGDDSCAHRKGLPPGPHVTMLHGNWPAEWDRMHRIQPQPSLSPTNARPLSPTPHTHT
jgi:hypothetical protein